MQKIIKIHESDTVAVAVTTILKQETVIINGEEITARDEIPAGHKMALYDMDEGSTIIKYGCSIGSSKEAIAKGSWIHTHNMKTSLGDLLSYTYEPEENPIQEEAKVQDSTFEGYVRSNGKVGIRNEIWIIPTVGCVNSIATSLARRSSYLLKGSVDEVVAFTHPYGCSQMGDDEEHTRTILADLIRHPNAGGVLVLGLGCENSNIEVLKNYLGEYDASRVKFLVCQDSDDEIVEGLSLLEELIDYAASFERETVGIEHLIVGLKCGGSDGFSGITANPMVGKFSDLLIRKGGITILTEVPEMFGAETLLMNRCENEDLYQQTVNLINNFKNYYTSHNQTIYENPSPGNKKGGISTLEEKSLGCTQKSGTSPVKGVLEYGSIVKNAGLNLLSAPGNDLVAATALAASGAQIILFTTGRGTPFASPVPTVKISSNSYIAHKKSNWIDFNAGILLEDQEMEDVVSQFYTYILEVANGRKVCAEKAGFHDMAIFKHGVTL
jgi:altronate hydrolase